MDFEISLASEVKRRLDAGEKLHLIDVREPNEYAITRIEGSVLIPMRQVPAELQSLEGRADEAPLIVFCPSRRAESERRELAMSRAGARESLPEYGGRDRCLEFVGRSYGAEVLRDKPTESRLQAE